MINVNHVVLVGRLTKDIELRKTNSGASVCSFTVAIDRRFQSQQQGGQTADFISCIAWRQSADFLANYAAKGTIVSVEGRIQTRSYDGQNGKVYVTEVV
ncbi:MAG: single-stranded DNA-binding protein, partial [Erysipelotrichaceae bacterium]|nr:single-stranded DNA-binding protein [Erysipelotrichaceae bacterium]